MFGYEKDNPSDEYFKTKILEQKSISSKLVPEDTLYTINLSNAKTFFQKGIKNLNKKQLEELFKKVTSRLKFIFNEIDNDLDVYVTFETMNNRGKDLTKLELLKNRLIYLTTLFPDKFKNDKERLRNDINEAWKIVYEYLGKDIKKLEDDNFLYHHWIMYFKFEKSKGEAFARFLLKEHFTFQNLIDNKIKISNIKNYVESISNSVVKYYYIFNPSKEKSGFNSKTISYLSKINRQSFSSFLPIIIAAQVRRVNETEFLELLKAIERFIFIIFSLSRRSSHTKSAHFFNKANEFYKRKCNVKNLIEDIKTLTDDCDEGWIDIASFKSYIEDLFKRRNEQGYYEWTGLKYLLYEYELFLQRNSVPKIKWEDIEQGSIEHILPQDMSDPYWKSKFKDYSAKQKNYLLNSLGNLLLLSNSKNSEYKNHSFKVKKKHKDRKGQYSGYFNGSYSEIEVAQETNWTPKQILDRGLKLLEFIEKNWNVDLGTRKQKKELLGLDFI